MKCNVGKTDRTIRFLLGMIIIVLGFIYENWWGLIGLIPLLTGLIKWCPLYLPFKISTVEKEKE